MTHAINLNTNLLSIDITRTHTQMSKSSRGKRAGRKCGESTKKKKKKNIRKIGIKEKTIKTASKEGKKEEEVTFSIGWVREMENKCLDVIRVVGLCYKSECA